MNRMLRIGWAAAAATLSLVGCAGVPRNSAGPDLSTAASGELSSARDAWAQCVQAAIPRVEDPQSSSETVAGAAMKRCAMEYSAVTQALTRALTHTCSGDSSCTANALAKAKLDATRSATDEVVNARVAVANAQVLKCQ